MTDEEKEAIEWLKRLVKINKRDNLDNTFAEILLNLIEKQSKETEELKEKNEYLPNWVSKKYVNKDKIKDKIEELKHKDFIKLQVCYQHDNKALVQIEVLEELLKDGGIINDR